MSGVVPKDRAGATLGEVLDGIVACERCPRLRAWCRLVAKQKKREFRDWSYWGRPVPGFGDPRSKLLIVGLAPGAHGANRTGRMFTGDRSGDFLYAGLFRAGFASQPTSVSREDGLRLKRAFITAAARCAPPDNKPLPVELESCAPYPDRELALLRPRVVLALGAIAWEAALGSFARGGVALPRPRPRFAHRAELALDGAPVLIGSYHVSQQNTQTGRLTEPMFDAVLARARALLG